MYIIDNAQRVVRRLGADGSVSTAADLPVDPFGARDPVGLATGLAAAGPLYLVDTVGSRIFSMPAATEVVPEPEKPLWPWIPGGAVAVLLMVLFLVVRRRRGVR